jgi:hypothetical protein
MARNGGAGAHSCKNFATYVSQPDASPHKPNKTSHTHYEERRPTCLTCRNIIEKLAKRDRLFISRQALQERAAGVRRGDKLDHGLLDGAKVLKNA